MAIRQLVASTLHDEVILHPCCCLTRLKREHGTCHLPNTAEGCNYVGDTSLLVARPVQIHRDLGSEARAVEQWRRSIGDTSLGFHTGHHTAFSFSLDSLVKQPNPTTGIIRVLHLHCAPILAGESVER